MEHTWDFALELRDWIALRSKLVFLLKRARNTHGEQTIAERVLGVLYCVMTPAFTRGEPSPDQAAHAARCIKIPTRQIYPAESSNDLRANNVPQNHHTKR